MNNFVEKNYDDISSVSNILKFSTAKSYVAFSGYYYISVFFGIEGSASIADLGLKTSTMCETSWDHFVGDNGFDKYTADTCLNSSYVQELLTKYGFLNNTKINFTASINKRSVDWSDGAAIYIFSTEESVN